MENVKALPLPAHWVHKGDGMYEEYAAIEYKRLRVVVYRRPGMAGWYASAHPIYKRLLLKANSIAQAKLESIQQLRQHLSALALKMEVLDMVTTRQSS